MSTSQDFSKNRHGKVVPRRQQGQGESFSVAKHIASMRDLKTAVELLSERVARMEEAFFEPEPSETSDEANEILQEDDNDETVPPPRLNRKTRSAFHFFPAFAKKRRKRKAAP